MWKEVLRTGKKEVLSSRLVESSRPSLTTVRPRLTVTLKAEQPVLPDLLKNVL